MKPTQQAIAVTLFALCAPLCVAQALFPPTIGFDDFQNGSAGIIVNGAYGGDQTGSAAGFADVNGDGFDDLLIGSERLEFDGIFASGGAYVVFGPIGPSDGPVDLRTLYADEGGDGSRGFVLRGGAAWATTGHIMNSAGDLNDDGIEDIYVSTSPGPVAGSGLAVIFGRRDGFAPEIDVLSLATQNGGDGSDGVLFRFDDLTAMGAASNLKLRDFNGDGISDLLYPTYEHAYVIFGRAGPWPAEFNVADLLAANGGDGSAGVALDFAGIEAFSVIDMTPAGDVNGDGLTDVILGDTATNAQFPTSSSMVIYGWSQNLGAEFALSSVVPGNGGDGSRGTVLQKDVGFDSTGQNVGGIGDINNDGFADVAVGAPTADVGGRDRAGRMYVVYGQSGGLGPLVSLSELANTPGAGFVLEGQLAVGRLGAGIVDAGDLNGDGADDLVLSAPSDAQSDRGKVWTVFGPIDNLAGVWPMDGTPLGAAPVTTISIGQGNFGDLDGDGANDLAITSFRESNPPLRPNSGRVYVLWGRSDADADADGVANRLDNCSELANPAQIDADGDGFGNACDADLNNSCVVNVADLGLMRTVFFTADPVADFNGDGVVNVIDLAILRSAFFAPPGPSGLVDCAD